MGGGDRSTASSSSSSSAWTRRWRSAARCSSSNRSRGAAGGADRLVDDGMVVEPARRAARRGVQCRTSSGRPARPRTARHWFGYVAMHTLRLAAPRAKSLDASSWRTRMEGMELPPEVALQPGQCRLPRRRPRADEPASLSASGIRRPAAIRPICSRSTNVVPGEKAAERRRTGCNMTWPAAEPRAIAAERSRRLHERIRREMACVARMRRSLTRCPLGMTVVA